MKDLPLKEWACRLLEDQLVRLDELRNANPRDPGFKLWRQTTLTVIQRVWPGNLQRSERFRRIPFTAPSAKPTRAQVREHFERGCSEASSYLRGLILEIGTGALDPARAADAGPAEASPRPQPNSIGSVSPESAAITASLKAPLPGERVAGAMSRPERTPPPSAPNDSVGERPESPPPAKRAAPPKATKTPRKSDRRALKEMLGFADDSFQARPGPSPPPDESYAPPRPAPSFADLVRDEVVPFPIAPAAPELAFETPERVTDVMFEPVAAPKPPVAPFERDVFAAPKPPVVPFEPAVFAAPEPAAASFEPAVFAAPEPVVASFEPVVFADLEPLAHVAPEPLGSVALAPEPLTVAIAAADLVTPARHVPGPEPRTAAAATLVALAGEVASLGVPEGQRAATRAALIGLSRQIDERSAGWDSLRHAFGVVMDYPPLARRVVPLLVPYMDLE